MAATTKDILVTVYAGERRTEWEMELVEKCDGRLEIRWQDSFLPDGTARTPADFDPGVLEGATMLYTYTPIPAGELGVVLGPLAR